MEEAKHSVEEASDSNRGLNFIKQVIQMVSEQNISGYAQMVAYSLLFATAPVLMVLVAGASAITRIVNADMENPARPVLDWMTDTMPQEAAAFLQEPLEQALQTDSGFFLSVGALLALWGARGAVSAIIRGLNMAYGVGDDPRSFVKQSAVSIGIALLLALLVGAGGLVFALGSDLGATVAGAIGLEGVWNQVSSWIRWPLIAAIAVFAVMVLHRCGPAQRFPFRWYLPGAIFTVVAMYVATLALGVWLSSGQSFSATYGVFGAVLAFVLWLYIMGFVMLLGGVVNAVLHEQRNGSTDAPVTHDTR